MTTEPHAPRTAPSEATGRSGIDAAVLAENLRRAGEYSAKILQDSMSTEQEAPAAMGMMDLAASFTAAGARAMADPAALTESNTDFMKQYAELIQNVTARALGKDLDPVVEPAASDRRFRDAAWNAHPAFDYMKQSYLLATRWMEHQLDHLDGVDERTALKVRFYTRQFIDAMSPSNFAATNPEVLRTTLESNGENLVRGLARMQEDVQRGNGRLDVTTTDLKAFEVGKTLAITPGKVVFQNDLMQLIQYTPTTEQTYRRPLLVFPPWINKYYILDLQPQNSFIAWAVEQGYTVFVVSWANPDERLATLTFDDYILDGYIAALDAVEEATGERQVSTIGYCIGGTALAATLAYLEARGEGDRVASATFFAAQVDFTEAGDLLVFADEQHVQELDDKMSKQGGLLDSQSMVSTFNMLRPNDLIWSNVINHYLLGKDPRPFDLLFWNADATRIPRPAHTYYLRNMYLENNLVVPDALEVNGTKIDLRRITTPMYVQAAEEDHIAPARSVFKMLKHASGPIRFMLSGSGHIAGVVNPPAAGKYHYRVTPQSKQSLERQRTETLEEWKARAKLHKGSWWGDWHAWLSRRSGRLIPARIPGEGALPAIEDAPGSYVLVRSVPIEVAASVASETVTNISEAMTDAMTGAVSSASKSAQDRDVPKSEASVREPAVA